MSVPALVTGVVCTRNRPESLARAVSTLLAGQSEPCELLVVDQSDDPLYQRASSLLPQDARLRHVRSVSRGKGKALNEALHLARGTILVCTDDDCQAPRNWMSDMARALESQPTAALAFCQVLPVAHDSGAGYVPAYSLVKSRMLRSIADMCGGLGIGAGMAVRRDFLQSIGGFDESFGPGSRFPSADEWDLAIRSLLRGWHVFETSELTIEHDGFRTLQEGREHARRDWIALGAVCAKPLRAGHWKAAVVPVWLFSTKAVWPPLSDAFALRRPRGAGRIVAFVTGFAQGLRSRVEAETLRFR